MTTTQQARDTYGTTISSSYRGKGKEAPHEPGEQPWEHHAWEVTLTRGDDWITVPFRMGLAHEQTPCGKRRPQRFGRYEPPMPCQHVRCQQRGYQPTPPDLYDVLTSLKADATLGETFAEWCDNYGYDTDSRRAMNTYLACQASEDQSRRFFGADWQRILEDESYT